MAEINRIQSWQRELKRSIWKVNFKIGAEFDNILQEQEEAFRAIWAEIGTRQ